MQRQTPLREEFIGAMAIDWLTDVAAGVAARKDPRRPLFADFWSPG
jgi:hypothetical protein